MNINVSLKKINLLVSNWCNLHCKMCDYRLGAFSRTELSLEEIEDLIKQAVELGLERLDLSGGEPMVRKEIYQIIKLAGMHNVRTLLVTNGILIGDGEAEKLLDAGVNAVIISMEGFEETNDIIRGQGSYNKALNALKALLKYKEKLDYVNVGITVSKANYKEIFDFSKFLIEDVGVHSISYNPFDKGMLYHENFEDVKDFFTITENEIEDLKEELLKIIIYKKETKKPLPPENYLRKIPQYFQGEKMLPQYPCYEPLTGCAIDSSGYVFPCWGEGEWAGNIKEQSITDIVNSKKYIDICKKGLTRTCNGCLKACYTGVHL